MVNYCCVQGCGRNSKHSSHLNYYSLPKGRERQEQWLKAAGREDLIDKIHQKLAHRFCSRHFAPSSIKNRNLSTDAIPSLCLPGSNNDEYEDEPLQHQDIICNSCNNIITGFRYKCVSCLDYDLCPKCEMLERHAHHYMIRIPKPLKFKIADDLITKWRDFFKREHVKPDCNDSTSDSADSSDDEPITKYSKHCDSGVDLSEDVKESIRKEIKRVLNESNLKDHNNKTKRPAPKERVIYATKRKQSIDISATEKKPKVSETFEVEKVNEAATSTPEVAFADVDNFVEHTGHKYEIPIVQAEAALEDPGQVQPVMHVKLSDDLSELMIEMTQNGQKTLYSYEDESCNAWKQTDEKFKNI